MRSRRSPSAAAGWALVLIGACTPAMDWRELPLDDTGVSAMLPCKPSVYERKVQLAGSAFTMTLRACSTDQATWAVAYATLQDPSLVQPVLRALSAAAASNLGVPVPSDARSWSPRGATPGDASVRWRADGHLPDGRAVGSRTAVFARGLHVFQATAIGRSLSDDDADTFFEGLRVPA